MNPQDNVSADGVKPDLNLLPDEIKSARRFLLWKEEQPDKPGGKPRKVPCYVNGLQRNGALDTPKDVAQLVTFKEAFAALKASKGFAGLGFALGKDGDHYWQGIDLDGLSNRPQLNALVPTLPGYVETSPSGNGVHALGRGQWFDNMGSNESGIEAYCEKRFFTITGDVKYAMPLTDLSAFVQSDLRPRHGSVGREVAPSSDVLMDYTPSHGTPLNEAQQLLAQLNPDMSRDKWLKVGMALHHEYGGDLHGFALWDEWSQGGAKYGIGQSIERVWESFKSEGRVVTMATIKKMVADSVVDTGAVDAQEAKLDRFRLIPLKEFLQRKRIEWLVRDVLPKGGLCVVYGASGSGKSFVTLDIAMHIVQGLPWQGQPSMKTGVAYIACEGVAGFPNRIRACALKHGVDPKSLDLFAVEDTPDFLPGSKHGEEIAAQVLAHGNIGLVINDTLSRAIAGGNENSAEVMTSAVKQCGDIQRMTGATVLLVHHSGKDAARGSRGHSALRAACDAEFEVVKTTEARDSPRTIQCTKQKEGPDGDVWGFNLESVHLYDDEDGRGVFSASVAYSKVVVEEKPLSKLEQALYDAASEALPIGGEIDREVLIAATKERIARGKAQKDKRGSNLRRGLKSMVEQGRYFSTGGSESTVIFNLNECLL